jgi:RHS repeat-associated protein
VRSGGPPNPGYQDQRYYPYGVEFPTTIPPGQPGAGQLQYSTPNDREKYATYARDSATGLDYAVNRYYASIWGRFLSPDPQDGGYTSEPQSLNLYGYVLGDPVNFNDPDGLDVHFPLKPGPLNCLNTRVMLYARASNSSQLDAFFNSAAGTWAMTLFLEEDHGSLSDRHTTWALMSDVFANRKYLDPGWASQAHINQGSWQNVIRASSSDWSGGDLTRKAYDRMARVFNGASNSADCDTLIDALAFGSQMLTVHGAGPLASTVLRDTLFFYLGSAPAPNQISTKYWNYARTASSQGFSLFRIWPVNGKPGDLLNPPHSGGGTSVPRPGPAPLPPGPGPRRPLPL